MSEHDEHPPAEGAVPVSRESGEPPADPAARPAPPVSGGPPPRGETLEYGAAPRESRFRRWSGNGAVRAGALAIVAGLVGGLVGGGIVAAFDGGDGHDDRSGPVRIQRQLPGGAPGFRGPRYWGQQGPNGRGFPNRRIPQPATPATPTPSPKTSG
jgi:hypothetical protein